MITVFTEAGYKVAREFEDGVIMVEFDIAPTDTSFGVMQAREQRSEALSIARLLTPSSVAVIGASRREGTIGNALLRNLRDGGFPGRLYAVNTDTEADEIEGVPAYPTIRDVDDTVDLAVVAVRAEMVADVILDCAAKGVRGLVVVSSGFAEIGDEGRKRQRYLVGLARSYGMRVIGPNALGLINTAPGVSLNATLSPLMPSRGRVAFFCQSGALGVPILADMVRRGLGPVDFRLGREPGRCLGQRPDAVLVLRRGDRGRAAVPGVAGQPAQVQPGVAAAGRPQAGGRAEVRPRHAGRAARADGPAQSVAAGNRSTRCSGRAG